MREASVVSEEAKDDGDMVLGVDVSTVDVFSGFG